MKIVIAAWHVKDFNVGLGRYCRGLIEAIGRVDTENRYEVLIPDSSYRFPERPNMRYRLIRFPVFRRRFWEQLAPLLIGKYDLLHLPYDSCVAWKRGKLVVTVHDVKPRVLGSVIPSRNLNSLLHRVLVRDQWGRTDHVLTDSQCSRRDIIQYLGVSDDRITVVYPGVELDRFRPALNAASGERERPYVLSVAGADPSKNVETLVDAFARLPRLLRDGYDLVLVGDFRLRQDIRQRVSQTGIEKQTIFPGIVSDDHLISLYQGAALFVFPSRYEGFGLPVLEAMACGCPVISSNASSLPEVTGDSAILVDPSDVGGFAQAMEEVLSNPELRQSLHGRGLSWARKFSWDRTALDTIEVYKRVAASHA